MFEVCELGASVKEATMDDLSKGNKVLVKAKNENVILQFKGTMKNLTLEVYNDASFANLRNGGSQGGYIKFLKDDCGNLSPIMWQSKRLQRVVKSTMAAETLIQVEAAEAAFWLSNLLTEVCGRNVLNSIICYTDSRQLFEAVHSIKSVVDKRLRIDLSILKEMIDRGEITDVKWIDSKKQIANCLTKRGASAEGLLRTLQRGGLQ